MILSYHPCFEADKNLLCAGRDPGVDDLSAIDYDMHPALQETAMESVKDFCSLTKINLAGFDILFSSETRVNIPLFLEINYYFGRRGLGGSKTFYDLLTQEIMKWIESLGLALEN
ncbi:MAG: hypothetical protein WB792_09865 [Desulfobacterales bacterium]